MARINLQLSVEILDLSITPSYMSKQARYIFCSNKFYSVLFYSILISSILFHSIPLHSILFYSEIHVNSSHLFVLTAEPNYAPSEIAGPLSQSQLASQTENVHNYSRWFVGNFDKSNVPQEAMDSFTCWPSKSEIVWLLHNYDELSRQFQE